MNFARYQSSFIWHKDPLHKNFKVWVSLSQFVGLKTIQAGRSELN